MLSINFVALYDHTVTALQESQQAIKRPCHGWRCLRLPQSCLSGLTLQLVATDLGRSCWPRQGAVLGRAACRAGSWLMGRESSAAKKPFHCREEEWPYFCSIFLRKLSVTLQHVKPKQTQFAVHRVTGSQQGWGWLAPLEMALSSPLHRARLDPAACMGLCPVEF